MGMIICERPGLQVICGMVTAVEQKSVIIENTVWLPMYGVSKPVQCRIWYDSVEKMGIKTGAFIVASVRITDELGYLARGIWAPSMRLETSAYVIRYTGSFDFEEIDGYPEMHIFCGNIIRSTVLQDGSNLYKVEWRRKGTQQNRNVMLRGCAPAKQKNIFVTGGPVALKNGSLYLASVVY